MTIQETLKEREIEVLRLMAKGMSNREIAEKLYIGVETVKWYAKNIYSKLDVANRKEAARKADELGLLLVANANEVSSLPTRHNLPTSATDFLGREQEIEHVASLLVQGNNRLVTILAAGGMGKSRLSIEVAHRMLDDFRDGVFFVPLAPLSSADDIVTTMIDNIGFNFEGDNIFEKLLDALQQRSMLLVLDNFEHLLDGTTLITHIIQSTTKTKIIVTSRERLNIYGELVYHLNGMIFPTWETPADALEYDAVRLFLQSARRNRADFEINPNDLDYLARICKLTQGMPLGIELAAGWVDVLSLEQISDEIQSGIDIFETQLRDVPERHRSLRITFERTWQRLSLQEQDSFMKLSVFRGGFTTESAMIVADATLHVLQKLSRKALIQFTDNGRFAIHELVRQFGIVKLKESGNFQQVKHKHAEYFSEFAAERGQDLKCERQVQAATLIDPDFENIRLAWYHLSDNHQLSKIPSFLYALRIYCDMRSRHKDADSMFDYTLRILDYAPKSEINEMIKGRLLAWASWHLRGQGKGKKYHYAEEAITILEGKDDALHDLIIAHHTLATIATYSGDRLLYLPSAKKNFIRAQKLNDPHLLAHTAIFAVFIGFEESPTDLLKQAKYYAELTGDRYSLWMCTAAEGLIAYKQGNIDLCQEITENGIKHMQDLNSTYHLSQSNRWLGMLALDRGQFDKAKYYFLRGLHQLWGNGVIGWKLLKRVLQADIYKGDYHSAMIISQVMDEIPKSLTNSDYYEDTINNTQILYEDLRAELDQRLEEEQLEALWQDIKKLTPSELVHTLTEHL